MDAYAHESPLVPALACTYPRTLSYAEHALCVQAAGTGAAIAPSIAPSIAPAIAPASAPASAPQTRDTLVGHVSQ